MKKVLFMMLMLAMAGVASSCEKEPESYVPENNTELENNKETAGENYKGEIGEKEAFLGLWRRTAESGIQQVGVISKREYYWRFYEDGTGHLSIDDYDYDDVISGYSRSYFSYRVEGNVLYVLLGRETEEVVWDYWFEGEELHLIARDDEEKFEYVFTKTADASNKFVGDWMRVTYVDGKRVDKHFKFRTPGDGETYESKYNEAGAHEGLTRGRLFNYTFDKNKIYISYICSGGGEVTYYYKLDGKFLYLSKTPDGIADAYVCHEK